MRRKVSIIVGLLSLSLLTLGQISLTYKTHGFRPGDSHDFVFVTKINEGADGANVIWDFSNLEITQRKLTSKMLNISDAPQNIDSKSNFVLEEFGNYFYFNNSSEIMEQWGTVSGNTLLKYDKPIVKLKFPIKYGYKIAGNFSGVQIAPGCSTPITGTYEINADAYGTLILPNNVVFENVLRVKQSRNIRYGEGNTITEVTYRWYAANIRYPVFVVIKYITPQQTYVAESAMYAHVGTHKKSATDVSVLSSKETFDVFPNPFANHLTLRVSLDKPAKVSVDLYDISGKLVYSFIKKQTWNSGIQNIDLPVESLNLLKSTYYLKITTKKQSIIRKIVKK